MNFEGYCRRYKINRPLDDYEKKNRLFTRDLDRQLQATSRRTVIRINPVFMETVDKLYPYRGVLLLFFGPLALLFATGMVSIVTLFAQRELQELEGNDLLWPAFAASAILAFWAMGLGFSITVLRHDIFSYTHHPVRLNRSNGTVHVFRSNTPDGVLRVNWNEVNWVLARSRRKQFGGYDYEIRGHVMEPDRITVRDTFSLGECSTDRDVVQRHWEHFRRYMEGGPGRIKAQELLPLHGRREGFWFGMKRAGAIFSPCWIIWLLLAPIWATMGAARWVSMRTSRQPRWPAEVEAECQVRPGDEPRKKDTQAEVGDCLTWVRLVSTSLFGMTVGACAYHWLLTESGYAGDLAETLQRLWQLTQ